MKRPSSWEPMEWLLALILVMLALSLCNCVIAWLRLAVLLAD